jgi:hypothetical protein
MHHFFGFVNRMFNVSRNASKSNFLNPGEHRESPLHAFVGAGLQVGVPARKSYNLGDLDASLPMFQ